MQRWAAEASGLTYFEEEAVEGEPIVERMGARVDGIVGRESVPEWVIANLIILAFWVLGSAGEHG